MKILTWNKISGLAMVLGLALIGSGCSKAKHNAATGPGAVDDNSALPSDDNQNAGDETPTEEDYTAAYSVLNFRQLAAAYERATGVTLSGPVLQEYERQLSSLPTDPDPTAVSASQVSAATKLAAAFCDVLSTDQNLRSQRFPDIDFGSPIANTGMFAEVMLETFFGPENSLQGDRATDIATVSELTDFLLTVPNAQTPAVFMGACAAVLSSAEYYLY